MWFLTRKIPQVLYSFLVSTVYAGAFCKEKGEGTSRLCLTVSLYFDRFFILRTSAHLHRDALYMPISFSLM